MGDEIIYGAIIVGLLVLGYGIFGMPSAQSFGAGTGSGGTGLQGSGTGGARLQGTPPSQCGNINDPKNLQHLSHHPDQFQDCYPYVDPGKFQQAVGQPLSNFMRG